MTLRVTSITTPATLIRGLVPPKSAGLIRRGERSIYAGDGVKREIVLSGDFHCSPHFDGHRGCCKVTGLNAELTTRSTVTANYRRLDTELSINIHILLYKDI